MTIYKLNTSEGPLYMTSGDYAKYKAYTKILTNYERGLVKRYGQQFNLLIHPSEYNKAIWLHNRVNNLVNEIRSKQPSILSILKSNF